MTYTNEELTALVNSLQEVTSLLKEIAENDDKQLDILERRMTRLETRGIFNEAARR